MAEIQGITRSSQQKRGRRRLSKAAPRVDLTPMVDLGFLLITFFMLTMEMTRAQALPWDKRISTIQEPIPACCVLNMLIDSADRVYTYEGEDIKNLQFTSFTEHKGLHDIVMQKGMHVKKECGLSHSGVHRDMICLIKLLPGSRFKNLTDVVDEMNTFKIQYSIQEPLNDEVAAIQQKEKTAPL